PYPPQCLASEGGQPRRSLRLDPLWHPLRGGSENRICTALPQRPHPRAGSDLRGV
ncbi:uncharacterized protein METZ01_LOCUS280824, partial [marine metagenome]